MTAKTNDSIHQQSHAVLSAIRRILRATEHYSTQLQKQTGLTTAKLTVLKKLAQMNGSSLLPLAEAIGISQATLTVLVVQLETRGLVIRLRDEQDRRRIHLHLTDQGHQLLETAPSLIQDTFQQRFAGLSVAEREQMITTLNRVATMMDDHQPAAPVFTSEELV